MPNNNEKILFQTVNYVYIKQYIYNFMIGISIFLMTGIEREMDGPHYDIVVAKVFAISILVGSIIRIYLFYKNNNKINFYENKIYINNNTRIFDLKEINEVYKVSYFYFLSLMGINKINRLGMLGKLVMLILSPLLYPSYLTLLLINKFILKKHSQSFVLIVIGRKDSDFVYFEFEDKEDNRLLTNFIKNNLNMDLEKINPILFIPKNV